MRNVYFPPTHLLTDPQLRV